MLSPKVEPPLPCQLEVHFWCVDSANLWLIIENIKPSQEYFCGCLIEITQLSTIYPKFENPPGLVLRRIVVKNMLNINLHIL